MQNGFIGEIHCSRPKLVNGSENRCSFIFDKKYDELRWFRPTRVAAYGMNVFRCFVRSLFTCWACVTVANPKVKINTERMSFFMLCIASVLIGDVMLGME